MTTEAEALVVAHIPEVRRLAAVMKGRVPRRVEYEDLVSDGYVGLVQSALSYSSEMGTFSTYAYRRILGAMLDGMKSLDKNDRRFRRRYQRCPSTVLLPTDFNVMDSGDGPDVALDRRDRACRVRAAARSLEPRERHILLRRLQGWTESAIGHELGVTVFGATCPRVNQIKARMWRRLAEYAAA